MPGTAAQPDPAPEIRGYCAPPALAELIRDLYLEERSGVLIIARSGVEKRLILDRGMILAACSSLEDERLPAFLAARGLLPPDAAEALRGLDDRQAAEALVQRGQLEAPALEAAVRDLALQVLSAVFRWEELEYAFEAGAVPSWPITTNVMVSFELIIRSLRAMAGFEPVRQAVLRQERGIRLSEDLYLPFGRLALTPIEGYLVSRIDGRTRARDILAQVPAAEEENAARFLFGLLILGLAQFYPPLGPGMLSCAHLIRGDEEKRQREEAERREVEEFYALASTADAAVLLGVRAGASQEEVKAAYDQKKEKFDLSRFLRRVQVEKKEELQIIEARLVEAFLALRARAMEASMPAVAGEMNLETMSKRKELNKTELQSQEQERARLAGLYFLKARDYWKMGDIYNCIRYCEFARNHNEGDADIQSLLGQALARNPDHRWQRRAEAALVRAAEIEAFNPVHWVTLGEFYRQNGLVAKARKQFEKALEIQPNHALARQALASLPPSKG